MKGLLKSFLSFGLVVFTIGTGALANAKIYQTQLKTYPLLIASSSSSQPGRRTDPAYTVPSMVTGDFEIWLIADSNTRIHSGYLGHAWIALVVTNNGNGEQVLATRGFNQRL